jgi:membrane protein required for colicin V production
MNYIDIIIIVILIISAINGYKKGFVHQLFSLAALILGVFIAVKLSKVAAPLIQNSFSFSENTAKVTSFISIFILAAIGIVILGKMVERFFDDIELTSLNKLAGLVFAVIKTVFIVSVLFILLNLTHEKAGWPSEKSTDSSYLYKPIVSIAPAIFPYLKLNNHKN